MENVKSALYYRCVLHTCMKKSKLFTHIFYDKTPFITVIVLSSRDQYTYGISQWETTLQCNVVSHWLSPYPNWSLSNTCIMAFRVSISVITIPYGIQCVFPFFYNGQWYYGCTQDGDRGDPWCATVPQLPDDSDQWDHCYLLCEL